MHDTYQKQGVPNAHEWVMLPIRVVATQEEGKKVESQFIKRWQPPLNGVVIAREKFHLNRAKYKTQNHSARRRQAAGWAAPVSNNTNGRDVKVTAYYIDSEMFQSLGSALRYHLAKCKVFGTSGQNYINL